MGSSPLDCGLQHSVALEQFLGLVSVPYRRSAMAESSFVHIVFLKYGFTRPHEWNLMILTLDSESPSNLNPGHIDLHMWCHSESTLF